MRRKIIPIALSLLLAVQTVGCSNNENTNVTNEDTTQVGQEADGDTSQANEKLTTDDTQEPGSNAAADGSSDDDSPNGDGQTGSSSDDDSPNSDGLNGNDSDETNSSGDEENGISGATGSDELGETLINVSNLTDEASRKELDGIMREAGVSDERRTVFWEHVDQFNSCEGITGLTDGYTVLSIENPGYDDYDLQEAWEQQYPEFVGYNCRITAFTLMGDYISVDNYSESDHINLFMDEMALEEDDSALFTNDDINRFYTLFETIEGDNTNDSSRQAELVGEAWEDFGIKFDESVSMSLITVFFHDQFGEDDNELMIGHAGVLFGSDDGLVFVEKLAFQAPYRAIKFTDRDELREYLMAMYDTDYDQPTAKPFIFENGKLME